MCPIPNCVTSWAGSSGTLETAPKQMQPKPTWTTSWQEAVAESKASGKVILADFAGSDWCGWCKRLHAEVFNTREFVAWAKEQQEAQALLDRALGEFKTQAHEKGSEVEVVD